MWKSFINLKLILDESEKILVYNVKKLNIKCDVNIINNSLNKISYKIDSFTYEEIISIHYFFNWKYLLNINKKMNFFIVFLFYKMVITRETSIPEVNFLNINELENIEITEHKRKELNGELLEEPLLIENKSRFALFPIMYSDIWDRYKTALTHFWVVESVDLTNDRKDWDKLTDNERFFLSNILAFFANFDSIINENISLNFNIEFPIQEIRCFYEFQQAIENIHQEQYALLIDEYIKDPIEKNKLFNGIKTIPAIQKKAQWCFKRLNKETNSLAERLITSVILEGCLFSSSFCSIFYFKKRGLLPGLCEANAEIIVDEQLHTNFSILLYSKLVNKLSEKRIYEIFNEAIIIESEFVESSIPTKLIGINSDLMIDYVKFCADRLLVDLGYNKLYNKINPFDWMEQISLSSKSNFFEKNVKEYVINTQSNILAFDADF